MLYIDSHESIEMELLLSQCVAVERTDLNPEKGDLWWLGYGGKTLQLENKQAGEALGSLDSVEEQLGREMASCDYTGLTIRGIITPTSEGFCQTWQPSRNNPNIIFKDREYKTSYKGYRAWVDRLQALGVLVVEVPTLEALVAAVAAMYEQSLKAEGEHKTFNRLIPERYWLTEADQQKRDLALTAMSVRRGGWGEELALAAAGRFDTFAQLYRHLEDVPEEVAKIKLRNGTRTIGKAKVEQMRRALGL